MTPANPPTTGTPINGGGGTTNPPTTGTPINGGGGGTNPPTTGRPANGGGNAANPPANGGGTNVGGGAATATGRTFSVLATNTAAVSVTQMGSVTMADGQQVRVWSFSGDGSGFNGDRVMPAPVIEAVEGQQVALTLNSMMAHTIHPHGLDVDTANDGVPVTSGYVGRSMMGFGRVQGQTSLGTSYTYRFIAPQAGTYMYHCHVDAVLHYEMGMVGAFIVRPPDGSLNQAWANGPQFDKEYIWQLHTLDTGWRTSRISGPETVRYRPDYFMINGRDGAALQTDPTVAVQAAAGSVVLIRAINVGTIPARVSLGNLSFSVIASDGRPLPQPISATSQLLGPGERYDLLFTMPAGANLQATIEYYNIRISKIEGTANTTIVAA